MFADVLQNRCANFFFKIHKKTPAPESPFNKVTGLSPATLLKGKTPIRLFLDKVCKNVLWNIFYH